MVKISSNSDVIKDAISGLVNLNPITVPPFAIGESKISGMKNGAKLGKKLGIVTNKSLHEIIKKAEQFSKVDTKKHNDDNDSARGFKNE